MIMRSSESLVAIEGFVASHRAKGENGRTRQRIEIDTASGRITSVEEARGSGDLVLEEGHLVLPGLIDLHVHAREDATSSQSYKETFTTAGEAAIHGGVTAFAEMPNNPEPPVDDASYMKKRQLARACPVDVLLFAGIGPHTRPLSFPVPYKAYMGPSVGDLYFAGDEELRGALARYCGQTVAFHAESPSILAERRHAATHGERRPPEAEVAAIETALRLAEEFRIAPHICHLSTASGLEAILHARSRGTHVTCEVAPHHLFYDQDNASNFHHPDFLQANPPIRTRLDRIALLEAFRRGDIDYLATDHAPHSLEENERGISGMPHLDTLGGFLFWLREEGVSWRTLRLAASERPGKFLGRYLSEPFGRIEKGYTGSLTVLESRPQTVRRGALKTRSGWSPFEGCRFAGRVSHTVVRGKIYAHADD
jgi:dihydroorotase